MPSGTMTTDIVFTILFNEFLMTETGFLKYFAPADIFIAKLSMPTCTTFAFARPDTT